MESTHSLHNGCGAFFVFRGRAICVFLLFVGVASTTSFSSFYPLFLASLIVSRMLNGVFHVCGRGAEGKDSCLHLQKSTIFQRQRQLMATGGIMLLHRCKKRLLKGAVLSFPVCKGHPLCMRHTNTHKNTRAAHTSCRCF